VTTHPFNAAQCVAEHYPYGTHLRAGRELLQALYIRCANTRGLKGELARRAQAAHKAASELACELDEVVCAVRELTDSQATGCYYGHGRAPLAGAWTDWYRDIAATGEPMCSQEHALLAHTLVPLWLTPIPQAYPPTYPTKRVRKLVGLKIDFDTKMLALVTQLDREMNTAWPEYAAKENVYWRTRDTRQRGVA